MAGLFDSSSGTIALGFLGVIIGLGLLILLVRKGPDVHGLTSPSDAPGLLFLALVAWVAGQNWLALREALGEAGANLAQAAWKLAVAALAWRAARSRYPLSIPAFRPPAPAVFLWSIGLYAAAWPVVYWLGTRHDDVLQDSARHVMAAESALTVFALACQLVLATPILEEVIWRVLLQGGLAAALPRWSAIVGAAVLFTMVHRPVDFWPEIFLLGALLGFVRMRTGSPWPCVAIHALHNTITLIHYLNRG